MKTKIAILALISLLLLTLLGCSSQPSSQPTITNTIVRVTGYFPIVNKAKSDPPEKRIELEQYFTDNPQFRLERSSPVFQKWWDEYNKKYPLVFDESPLKFSGNILVIAPNGSSSSKSVEGLTPQDFSISGKPSISCTFQNQMDSGYLKVEILKGGLVVNKSDTTAAYGVVSVASN